MQIASLLPSATEIVCALGLEDNLIGVTHECDFPPGIEAKPRLTASRISHETMTSREIDHAVRSQLDGHGSIYDLDADLLGRLSPDMIITQELCDVCAVNYKTVSRSARIVAAGSSIISLEPNTIADIFDNILTVARLAGVEERGLDLVSSLTDRLEAVRLKAAAAEFKPRVMMLEWLDPPFAPGHWVPEQVEAAGGECLLGRAGERSVVTSYQAILDARPEVLVLIPCGYNIADIIRHLESTRFPAEWRGMPAIRDGRVWALDASGCFSRPGPRVIDGVETLARVLHPDIFGPHREAEAVAVTENMIIFQD